MSSELNHQLTFNHGEITSLKRFKMLALRSRYKSIKTVKGLSEGRKSLDERRDLLWVGR